MTRLDRTVPILGYRLPLVAVIFIALTLVGTIVVSNDRAVANALVLIPAAVWGGEVWRLVTWPLLVGSGLSLLFWSMLMFFVAPDLARVWRARRFVLVVLGLTAFTGGVVTLLGWLWRPLAFTAFYSAWAVADGLLVAWAFAFPDRTIRLSLILPLQGRQLVIGLFAITAIMSLVDGPVGYIPNFVAMLSVLLYVRQRGFETLWLKLRYRWLQLRMGRRKSAFRVVERDDSEPPRWMH